ncbi:DUF262 domain-containing protein [Psychroserpens jangbogonensis]|uniref:DUF262 domain-containing protein n=1 Tax=Psychroserpens jangbogonensis TaxID=1484460 RepID=UPI00068A9168|nr:DUF262 domain-containing protein [Psychroserpens jangbogonensis]
MSYTLFKLLQESIIKIPLIQRDYAQGRNTEEDVRNDFIDKLKEIIDQNNEVLNLDFIYGYTTKSGQDKVDFIPLDGQQRLTTLWLMHWYFACQVEVLNIEFKNEDISNALLNFTYETRISSKRFCEKLVNNPITINDVKGTVQEEIVNAPWFMSSWKNDPTIMAMLNMLDTIHTKLSSCEDVWQKLTENNIITFDYIDIKSDEFKLTDELYIKMNSRGKPLSPFENFKAIFSQLLNDKGTDYCNETKDYENSNISYQQYFAFNVDGKWTDLFWSYRDKVTSGLDDNFLNFFYYIGEMLHYKDNDSDNFNRNFESLKQVYSVKSNVDFLFNALDLLSKIKNIEAFFNALFSADMYVEDKVKLFEAKNTDLFFKAFTNSAFNVQQRVLLFGVLHFCIEAEIDFPNSKLKDFTRILRNLLLRVRQVNTSKRIEIISNLRLPNFFEYSKFIFEFVRLINTNKIKNVFSVFFENEFSGFVQETIISEQSKIEIINNNPRSCTNIIKLGEHRHTQAITDSFNLESNNINKYVDAFYEIWSFKSIKNSLLVRALLTFGDFSVTTHDYSRLGLIKYFGEKDNWNRILAPIDVDEKENVNNVLNLFLEDYVNSKKETVAEKLHEMIEGCKSKTKNWEYYFINYNEITSSNLDRFNLFTWGDKEGFNINSLGNSGVQPLASYHLNPYLITIKQRLIKDGIKSNKVDIYYGRYSEELSFLRLPKNIRIYVNYGQYDIYNLNKHKHSVDLIKEFDLQIIDDYHVLKESKQKDKIEVVVDFCKRFLELK